MRAAIDVGTNSIKLLLADGRRTVQERVTITRLGEGLGRTGRISEAAMRRAMTVIADYRKRCDGCPIIAAGTEALRKATNAAEFIERVRRGLGIEIRVLSGVEEGRLARLGGISDWPGAATIEIGAGSAQLSSGARTLSLPMGAVAMTERFLKSDPPTGLELLTARATMRGLLRSVRMRAGGRVVALGGTASTIGMMWTRGKRAEVHGLEIDLRELDGFVAEIAAEPVAVRRRRKGLEPDRADIIVAGGVILTESMRAMGATTITLSVRGLRHGLLMKAASGDSPRRRSSPSTPRRRERRSP